MQYFYIFSHILKKSGLFCGFFDIFSRVLKHINSGTLRHVNNRRRKNSKLELCCRIRKFGDLIWAEGFLIVDIRLEILGNFKGLLYPVSIVINSVFRERSRFKGGDPPTADKSASYDVADFRCRPTPP